MVEGINVLSLFDGMSCGQIALENLGFKVNNYFASEIKEEAIKVTKENYPNTKQIGSVLDVKGSDLPNIDLLIGGSPCQNFSNAQWNGQRNGLDGEKSGLFFEFVRLLEETKPKYFLLENVKMKKEYQDIISNLLGVQPININSKVVSAQMRNRLYWTNIGLKPGGLFGYLVSTITQPKDKGLILKDILENQFYLLFRDLTTQFKIC